jgi:pyridoxamine 5'-phosphate oxidase
MAMLDNLDSIETAIWDELSRAVRDRSHPWRLAVLATTDGQSGQARSVVLREVDPAARHLLFYTDSRSPKVEQMASHPAGTLVLWSQPLGWQLRLSVLLAVEVSGLAVSSRWATMKLSPAAHDYLSPLPPGSPLDMPNPERSSRDHFSVVTARIQQLDWLELRAEGQRRAAFDADGRRWLTP